MPSLHLLAALFSAATLAAGCANPAVHEYRNVDGRGLRAFVFAPEASGRAPVPAVLLFHGGGWAAGEAQWTFNRARRLSEIGLVAISIEYRLSEGTTTPVEALDDTCAAFRWVRAEAGRLGIDPQRVGGYGVSAGGHLVAAAAVLGCGSSEGSFGNGGPDALVLLSPALDLSRDGWFRKLLQGRADPRDYSPVEHVASRLPPTSIVHGARDSLTPLSGAQRFCEQARAKGNRCELHVYDGLGHLLTRNLKNQETDFDPDPAARADGFAKQEQFLRELWLQ